ncbi:MAG: hypothetical protein AABX70_04720 [Nanoarchaeota archaeon]
MVSVTLSVPPEVKKKMEKYDEINWSGYVRKAILEKTQQLDWKEKIRQQLKEEEPFVNWAVQTLGESRKKRLKELRKKGLLP